MSVFDLHVHTVRGSSDSSLTPEELIREAHEIGLDGVCLTEHGGAWQASDLRRTFEGAGVTVLAGLEVDTEMGHVLAFGLPSRVSGIHRVHELRKAVDRAGGVMISAHPFRHLFNLPPYDTNLLYDGNPKPPETVEEAARHPLFEMVDDVEVANGANIERENAFALEVARHRGFAGTGGSDAHSFHGLGRCATVFDGVVRTEADLIDALKAGAFRPADGLRAGRQRTLG